MSDTSGQTSACSPLGFSAEEFVNQARTNLGLARQASLDTYRDFFWRAKAFDPSTRGKLAMERMGTEVAPGSRPVAPISSVNIDEGAEGKIFKFTQEVPASNSKLASQIEMLRTESVLIPMIGKRRVRTYTLCVSSQVGCAMGCTFCETAQMGLIRSLTAEEIVQQWYAATHFLKHAEIPEPVVTPQGLEGPVRNIVFMGMGEPMDNLDNVLGAIDVLRDHRGPSIPISKITISTVGRVDGITKLAERIQKDGWHRLNLAISMNAADDEIRSGIMPINRRWNLAELQRALMDFPIYGGGKLCIEYVLIPGVNDSDDDVRKIAEFLAPINNDYRERKNAKTPRTLLNLIPYNPRRVSPWPAPTEEKVEHFLAKLIEAGVYAKRRRTKGRDLMGACGQLGAEHIRQRKLVDVTVSA